MTVALYDEMWSLVILSPFVAAVAVRFPLRFYIQCKSLSYKTDGFEKTPITANLATWHIA
jgi:hypothetical protein